MCPHEWLKVNDVFVCLRCGLTRTYDGKIMFDRGLPNYRRDKKHEKARNCSKNKR